MKKSYEVDCSTKKDKDSIAIRTTIVLDLSDLTEDDVLEYAVDALVVKKQGQWRNGADPIPSGRVAWKVPKPGTMAQIDPVDAFASMDEKVQKENLNRMAMKCGYESFAEFAKARGLNE